MAEKTYTAKVKFTTEGTVEVIATSRENAKLLIEFYFGVEHNRVYATNTLVADWCFPIHPVKKITNVNIKRDESKKTIRSSKNNGDDSSK